MSNQYSAPSRETLSAELVGWLRIAGDRLQELVAEHLKPFGLSVSQGILFGLIADWALRGVAPLQKDLEQDMRLVTSSITNLVQGLERKGMISRTDSPNDGRAKELHVTEHGWKVREALGRGVAAWEAALTAPMADDDLTALVPLLRKLARGAG
jgi:DNA-binding MarR family transcriptional regulator